MNMTKKSALGSAVCSAYYPLFEHMSQEHNLTLLDSEMEEIVQTVDKMRMTQSGVQWILVNALRHLDCEQLDILAEEIDKRRRK